MTQVMKSSEKKVGKKAYKHGYPSSKELRDAATKVIQTKKDLRRENIQRFKNLEKNRTTGRNKETPQTTAKDSSEKCRQTLG